MVGGRGAQPGGESFLWHEGGGGDGSDDCGRRAVAGFYRGQVVQVGSNAGVAYTASKHAVASLVRHTAAFAKTAGLTFRIDKDAVDTEDVARYCVFLADWNIARSTNGSCIDFNNN